MDNKIDYDLLARQKADGSYYAEKFEEEYNKMTPEEQAQVDKIMAKLKELMGDDDEDLEGLISKEFGRDSSWVSSIKDFFNKVNKTEEEKIDFLYDILKNKELLNEFTKEIVNVTNADELFKKYENKITNEQ